jgi:rhamnulose-1-phosphate aldolase/alcohol dehydrogenase
VSSRGSGSRRVQSEAAKTRRRLRAGSDRRRYPSNWDERSAAPLTPLERLSYRSNLLGSDRRLANWGGGNTSSKLDEVDHLGRRVRVLRVKGSGTDLANIDTGGFAGLRLDELTPLRERPELADATMVDHLLRSATGPWQPRPSIETLLHAFIPAPCVDHTHPDAIIALTCSPRGRELAVEAFGKQGVWIDYVRPGFALSKLVVARCEAEADARFVLLAKHGLVTWGETDRDCYEATLEAAERAAAVLETVAAPEPLGPRIRPVLAPDRRRAVLEEALPVLRGALSHRRRQVLEVDQSDAVLEFVGAAATPEVSQVGAACPDHLIHTKPRPLVLDCAGEAADGLAAKARAAVTAYERWYGAYYESHLDDETRVFPIDPEGPRVILIPGIGMVTAGADAPAARISNELYHRAIEVIRLASGSGGFASLSEAEAFAVEYWPLERYKLTLAPATRELDGRVALVTGAASGIGRASAELLGAHGAHVAIADVNAAGAREVAEQLVERNGGRRALALAMDVTDPGSVREALTDTVLEWGGVDIVVCCAGAALGAPIAETTPELWNRNFDVLARGYFLVAQAAVEVMRRQATGGSIVFVASKNALVAGRESAAYSAAKAAELHLARCLAEEVGADGIRVNSVNPDAVLAGSGIWTSDWRRARASAYGINESELEAHYRERTTLKVNVYPQDVAEAVLFFASERSGKTTGNILNVDGGVAAAFPR